MIESTGTTEISINTKAQHSSLDLTIQRELKGWPQIVRKYHTPSVKSAFSQMLSSFIPYLGLWVLMYFSLEWHYSITLALAVVNAFFLVRIFIIQHDCGHQSFFKSRFWNNIVGFCCSFCSSIPYRYWAINHNFHHVHNGQLEHIDIGDITTATVKEYREFSAIKRFGYRLYRLPPVMFVLGPLYYIVVVNRLPFARVKGWKKTTLDLIPNNLGHAVFYIVLAWLLGWKNFLLIQLPVTILFGTIAVWFFYVQHQHERTYKQWSKNWDYLLSAIRGSTFYKLPRMFNWLTGNIGYHHIHHLSSRIPNYNLQRCANENPKFQKYITTIGFVESLKCMFHKLWDEEQERMITFKEFYQREKLIHA